MNAAQMRGKCDRLRDEISRAYATNPRNSGYIRRLADEITAVESAISACDLGMQPSASDTMIVQASDFFQQLSPQAHCPVAEGLVDAV